MKKESARLSVGLAIFLGVVSCGGEGQMQEPDRSITIVSIILLIIIWGSVLYHKFVQGGRRENCGGEGEPAKGEKEESTPEEAESSQSTPPPVEKKGSKGKKRDKKRR